MLIYVKKLLYLRNIAVLNDNNLYKMLTLLRADKCNNNIVTGVANQSKSVIYDILKTAILFGYYNKCMRMLKGTAIYSKTQWKQMIWKRAWELENYDWSYRCTILKSTSNLRLIGCEGSYLVWWQISDTIPTLIR